MTSGERKKLAQWHESKSSDIFNFQEEMLKYCRSDVDILRRGCIAFRNTVIQATTVSEVQPDGTLNIITDGVDPFEFVTIASVCMGIFKTLFLAQRVKVEITRDQETSWHEIEAFEGVNGVRLDGNWVSLVDLEKDEFTNVGKRQLISPIAVVLSH